MARKRRRGGFGEAAGKHKEAFTAHAELSVARTLAQARQLASIGRCNDALLYLLSARGEVSAMSIHANGFSPTKGQRRVLEAYRSQLQNAITTFRSNCLCGR